MLCGQGLLRGTSDIPRTSFLDLILVIGMCPTYKSIWKYIFEVSDALFKLNIVSESKSTKQITTSTNLQASKKAQWVNVLTINLTT